MIIINSRMAVTTQDISIRCLTRCTFFHFIQGTLQLKYQVMSTLTGLPFIHPSIHLSIYQSVQTDSKYLLSAFSEPEVVISASEVVTSGCRIKLQLLMGKQEGSPNHFLLHSLTHYFPHPLSSLASA